MRIVWSNRLNVLPSPMVRLWIHAVEKCSDPDLPAKKSWVRIQLAKKIANRDAAGQKRNSVMILSPVFYFKELNQPLKDKIKIPSILLILFIILRRAVRSSTEGILCSNRRTRFMHSQCVPFNRGCGSISWKSGSELLRKIRIRRGGLKNFGSDPHVNICEDPRVKRIGSDRIRARKTASQLGKLVFTTNTSKYLIATFSLCNLHRWQIVFAEEFAQKKTYFGPTTGSCMHGDHWVFGSEASHTSACPSLAHSKVVTNFVGLKLNIVALHMNS